MKKMFLLTFCYLSTVLGYVYEVSTTQEMDKYKNEKGVLFLYDIDDTLIHLNQSVGTDQWFLHRYEELKKSMSKQNALDQSLLEWAGVQSISGFFAVEGNTAEMIAKQQEEGVVMLGFTTRDHNLARCTKIQLNTVGIDFTKSTLTDEQLFFMNGQNGVFFMDGVLFTAGTHKGDALFKLLEKVGFKPNKVVFINDKRQNIGEVEVRCEEKGIDFVGLRYGYLDKKVHAFDYELASRQFEEIISIPSDKEAANL